MSAAGAQRARRWRMAAAVLLLPLLAACSGGFDGRYAQVNEDTGEIRRNQDGTPRVILTIDGEEATISSGGRKQIWRASVADGRLMLFKPGSQRPRVTFRKEGDQIVTEEQMGEDRFVRL